MAAQYNLQKCKPVVTPSGMVCWTFQDKFRKSGLMIDPRAENRRDANNCIYNNDDCEYICETRKE
jgi:hypothetical protein